MATARKILVATGASSGLGFEAIKRLLGETQPYRFIIGARDVPATQTAFEKVGYDSTAHDIAILRLDLANMSTVKSFAQKTLDIIKQDKLDVLFLNAGMNKKAEGPGPHGSPWCESYVVNHLSQHYLTHLFREKLSTSHSRIVVVSSGAIRMVQEKDIGSLKESVKADSKTDPFFLYCATKFTQLLGAHWWRREFENSVELIAVSPGMVPGTGLGRNMDEKPDMSKMPDQITVEEGARNLVRAINQTEFPEDPEQIFLTSWGEWWPKDVYSLSLDKNLQDEFCPSKEHIETEAGIAA